MKKGFFTEELAREYMKDLKKSGIDTKMVVDGNVIWVVWVMK